MKIFLTGATGLIGRPLGGRAAGERPRGGGAHPPARGRAAAARASSALEGDPAVAGPGRTSLARCDACVHLAGEPVAAGRWTPERKAAIERSRVDSTRRVVEVIAAGGPRVLVCGSAVGFYGEPRRRAARRGGGAGAGVPLRRLRPLGGGGRPGRGPGPGGAGPHRHRAGARGRARCRAWSLPFKLMAGGPLGDGAAWQPWIHLDDEVALLRFALEDERVHGPLNGAAPAAGAQPRPGRRPWGGCCAGRASSPRRRPPCGSCSARWPRWCWRASGWCRGRRRTWASGSASGELEPALRDLLG